MRLDVFLKKSGIIRQRTRAREMCGRGWVRVDGKEAKAGRDIAPGNVIRLETRDEILEIEVVGLPERNYKHREGQVFYTVKHRESKPFF